MNTLSTIALGLSVLISSSGAGQSNDQPIVVSATPTVKQWSRNVSRDLDDNLRYPSAFGLSDARGPVSIAFTSAENGTSTAIGLVSSSSNRRFDEAALHAVRRLTSLRPMPSQFGPDQKFRANIFFANDARDLSRQMREYARSTRLNPPPTASRNGIVSLTVGIPATA